MAAAATERDFAVQRDVSGPRRTLQGISGARAALRVVTGQRALRSVTIRSVALSLVASGSALAADKPLEPGPASRGAGIVTKASTEATGYLDTDHVGVVSPSVAASVGDDVAGWSVGGHYLVDIVSAASVDIVSTASTAWHEIRQGGSADASVKFGDLTPGVSGVISSEPDYLSIAGGGTLTVDMVEKNVTPFIGFSYADDQVGRTHLPRQFWRDKKTMSGQLGVTFVVDRSTIASLQADVIAESGYLAKPYRYVPLFSAAQAAGIGVGASIDQVNAARLSVRAAEQLPNARHRVAFTGRLAHRFDDATLRVDERAYADTWGLLASTTEFRFLADVSRRLTLWPHLRFHVQNNASFWQRAYIAPLGSDGAVGVPDIRTGDRELSALCTGTLGAGARVKLVDDLHRPWSLVFEIDGAYTRYFDAIYILQRTSVFSTLAVETQF